MRIPRKREDRVPTEAELSQYDASDEEAAEMAAYIERVRVALINARIRASVEWSLVMLSISAKVLMLQGMGPEFFWGLMETCWGANVEPFNAQFSLQEAASTRTGNVRAMSIRLRGALLAAKIDTTSDMTCMALASLACRALSSAGVPIAMFEKTVRDLYRDGEQALAGAIQQLGAKA